MSEKIRFNQTFRPLSRPQSEREVLARATVTPPDQPEKKKRGKARSVIEILDDIMAMTPPELDLFRKKVQMTKGEKIALTWADTLEKLPMRGGPQVLAEAMDRLYGKVVLQHRLIGAGNKSEMSDAEIDALWRKRQSRAALSKSQNPASGPSLPS